MTDTNSPSIARSAVRRLSFHSNVLQADWKYVVYTPPGYETSGLRYPVLYLLHGNYGAPDDFVDQGNLVKTADALIAAGKMQAAVIAMPDGGQSWYLNHEALRMEDAILCEFIPWIEGAERVQATREARRIGGISMGGYGSLRYALKRPEMFSALALMSPAVYADLPHEGSSAWHGKPFCAPAPTGDPIFVPSAWHEEAYPKLTGGYFSKNQNVRFYIESGAQDEFGIAEEAKTLCGVLATRHEDVTFGLRDGGHDWTTWSAALETALPFLLGDAPAPIAATGL